MKNLVEDEYYLLITCPTYKVICEKYNELLDRDNNLSAILISPPVSAFTM